MIKNKLSNISAAFLVCECSSIPVVSFLYEQRVHLENMGAHDIVDGNARLTLGLIWTIILRSGPVPTVPVGTVINPTRVSNPHKYNTDPI